jgi:hypothetical protein
MEEVFYTGGGEGEGTFCCSCFVIYTRLIFQLRLIRNIDGHHLERQHVAS